MQNKIFAIHLETSWYLSQSEMSMWKSAPFFDHIGYPVRNFSYLFGTDLSYRYVTTISVSCPTTIQRKILNITITLNMKLVMCKLAWCKFLLRGRLNPTLMITNVDVTAATHSGAAEHQYDSESRIWSTFIVDFANVHSLTYESVKSHFNLLSSLNIIILF